MGFLREQLSPEHRKRTAFVGVLAGLVVFAGGYSILIGTNNQDAKVNDKTPNIVGDQVDGTEMPEFVVPTVTPEPERDDTRTYMVKDADTVSGIARRFGVTDAALLEANPSIVNPNRIYIGQVLNIPQPVAQVANTEAPSLPRIPELEGYLIHTVVADEWVWKIARQYGVSPHSILAANPSIRPDLLSIGQHIYVPR